MWKVLSPQSVIHLIKCQHLELRGNICFESLKHLSRSEEAKKL
jgi:hypothetical protein